MELRVSDDADRMGTRSQRNQPHPIARADQMIGRTPALGWIASGAPGLVRNPIIDAQALVDAKPHGVGIVAVGLLKTELALEQTRATGCIDKPACAQLLMAALDVDAYAVSRVGIDIDAPDHGVAVKDHAVAPNFGAQEIFQQSAIDLPGRCRQHATHSELGDRVEIVAAIGKKETETEFPNLRGVQMRAQSERGRQIIGTHFDQRFTDLVRGQRNRMRLAFEYDDIEIGELATQLQRERKSRKAAPENDDVVGHAG